MSQDTVFGEAETTGFMRVDKVDGSVRFYRVGNGISEEITEAEYKKATE